jgi:hypothetical protein
MGCIADGVAMAIESESEKEERSGNGDEDRDFYLYAIKKDGDDLCAIKKVTRTCVPSS